METFGNRINQIIQDNKSLLFLQGEMAQLTYLSFEQNVKWVSELEEDTTIPISYPLGYRADNTPIMSNPRNYTKEELIERFVHLGLNKLPIDAIFQLVTIMETLMNDILRMILNEYPSKIPSNKKVDIDCILISTSIEQAKFVIIDGILNEFAYKSPRDYAIEFEKYTSVKLLESPVYHKYIELKATRDIHIHNNGFANDIYLNKSGVVARVKSGQYLPVDIQYFLMSYEQCLQLNEILEKELDNIWPSETFRTRVSKNEELNKEDVIEKAIEHSKSEGKE
ncbi:hypothetical protein [Flavobacterium psychrophilum]|uniref:hypothetical protein n=1 Tax=Flavobacterium psychrophilum TaxID=96345 RepID=UPI001D08109F|nr:hypothetical protein [Flavobacterium psychrophilum]MCB5981807.1 hypothetical protein [Flavobacterium psychrophilum]MCB6012859.1 hypothetical protein [Flavobacterium psychrophilum]MCB6017618.1 hypothetical protein [Flavobacterium psychrophilum]MCB6025294.1 hypothetical protein [Flavobacterium psychrophilum]MCB6030222.1 hypothetical protein [Flavobacterium psychrophilum]